MPVVAVGNRGLGGFQGAVDSGSGVHGSQQRSRTARQCYRE